MTTANPTPICTIDATGIHKPTLAECLTYFNEGYLGIYGSDVEIESSTQDGEWLGLQAAALDDANAMCVQAYNAYRPGGAQGVGLSSIVKINGIERDVPSFSSAPLLIVGQFGATIENGIVSDVDDNYQWTLDQAVVEIPSAGQIAVTATCTTPGAITAPAGTITKIKTQTRGWQTVTNMANATPGAPVEKDAALRIRQSKSTMIPSNSMLQGLVGSLLAIPGVARLRPYENDTSAPDSNNIPGHSIALVIDGGDTQTIANIIAVQKGFVGTYGSTTIVVTDAVGVPHDINWFSPTEPNITWGVVISPKTGFSINTVALIQASLAAWTNAIGIGNGIQLTRAYAAAYLAPSIRAAAAQLQADLAANVDSTVIAADAAAITALNLAATTYEITALTVARDGNALAAADVAMAFNEAPLAVSSGVNVSGF